MYNKVIDPTLFCGKGNRSYEICKWMLYFTLLKIIVSD